MSEEQNMFHTTLYTAIGDFSRVRKVLAEKLSEVTKEIMLDEAGADRQDKLVLLLKDDTELQVAVNHHPGFIANHIDGMLGFYAQAECGNRELHQAVLKQISVFNCVVTCSFPMGEDNQRINHILNMLLEGADSLNAVLFLPDTRLISGEGKLILDRNGNTELESYIPVGNSDYLDKRVPESEADIARKERTLTLLEEQRVPYIAGLRGVMEAEASFRTPEEILWRLLPMYGVCAYSEVIRDKPRAEAKRQIEALHQIAGDRLLVAFTPEEQRHLEAEEPAEQDIVNFGWRYECCHVLLWALGYVEKLGYPSGPCDVVQQGKLIWNAESAEALLAGATPRTEAELLDAQDLLLRYDWACVDARIKGYSPPANLHGGVVYEWHRALNWLVGAYGVTNWDDVEAHT